MKSSTLCPVKSNCSGKRFRNSDVPTSINWNKTHFPPSTLTPSLSSLLRVQSESGVPVPARGTCWCSRRCRSYLRLRTAPSESRPEPSGRSCLAANPGLFLPREAAHLEGRAEPMRRKALEVRDTVRKLQNLMNKTPQNRTTHTDTWYSTSIRFLFRPHHTEWADGPQAVMAVIIFFFFFFFGPFYFQLYICNVYKHQRRKHSLPQRTKKKRSAYKLLLMFS